NSLSVSACRIRPRDLVRASARFAKLRNLDKATRSLESCSTSCVFRECYPEKESSFGFGRDEGGSLAGNESAIVLSSIFSRFACGSPGSTIRSSGSMRWTLTMFDVRFSREVFSHHDQWEPRLFRLFPEMDIKSTV